MQFATTSPVLVIVCGYAGDASILAEIDNGEVSLKDETMDKTLAKERFRGQKCPYYGVGRKDLARISHEEFILL